MAMAPLTEDDLADFLFNYFKAEYAPIRSFFSTAYAEPCMPQRWSSMGHELQPVIIRPANAQAQKDLESLDIFLRQRNLDGRLSIIQSQRCRRRKLHQFPNGMAGRIARPRF